MTLTNVKEALQLLVSGDQSLKTFISTCPEGSLARGNFDLQQSDRVFLIVADRSPLMRNMYFKPLE